MKIQRNTNENTKKYKWKYKEIQMKIERNTNKIERNTNVVYLARPDSNSWEQRSVERRLKKNKLRIGTFLWTILRNRYVKFAKILHF